jgi:hypothetical protein
VHHQPTTLDGEFHAGSLWAYPPLDAEVDDCDREDADPDECKLQPAVMA